MCSSMLKLQFTCQTLAMDTVAVGGSDGNGHDSEHDLLYLLEAVITQWVLASTCNNRQVG